MIQLNSIGLRADARTQAGEIILCIAADVEALEDVCDACHEVSNVKRLQNVLVTMLLHLVIEQRQSMVHDCGAFRLDATG